MVVNHDTREDLLAFLERAREAGADAVVAVDCGSTDGSLAAVAAAHPDVIRVALPNLGFGRGVNAGVAALRLLGGPAFDAVVVANADAHIAPGGAAALGRYLADHPEVGAVGPRVVFPGGRLQFSARAFPDIPTALGHAVLGLVVPDNRWTQRYRLTDWDHASERAVDWLSGCCIALDVEAFTDVGGFDPAYFMFVEDVDLCWRLGEAGWAVVFAPVTEVVHAVGASVGRRRTRMVVEHARSLDRFFARRYDVGPLGRAAIRVGLAGWAASVMAWSALQQRTHGQAA